MRNFIKLIQTRFRICMSSLKTLSINRNFMKHLLFFFSALLLSFTSFAVAPITGSSINCGGGTVALSDATSGGTWSSSNTGIATIGSSSGVCTGISPGTAIISYTVSGVSALMTVTVIPAISSITGLTSVCMGSSTTVACLNTGGSWSSSNTAVASVGSPSGTSATVVGISPGTSVISYSIGSGCVSTLTMTILLAPASITGTSIICQGTTSCLSDATSGGSWASSDHTAATVGSTGCVFGVAPGTSIIYYTLSSGCTAGTTMTVSPVPGAILGVSNICLGSAIGLSDGLSGGTWSTGNSAVAVVGSSSGVVTGVGLGSASITYTSGTGCSTSTSVTVDLPPSVIISPTPFCLGTTVTLSDAITGGTWSTSNPSVAAVSIPSSGSVFGTGAGTATITYTLGTACYATKVVTVYPVAGITGTAKMCLGLTASLTDAIGGGTWSSSTSTVATVSSSGLVSGWAAGTSTIYYTTPPGCVSSTVATVDPLPTAILGSTGVCVGSTTSLTDATVGGVWSGGTTGIATVTTSGGVATVTGRGIGTTTITYTSFTTGCFTTTVVTITSSLPAIIGPGTLCTGASVSFSDGTSGGAWTSSNTAIASVGSVSGLVNAISVGTSKISYTLGGGCAVGMTVTVDPSPGAITGTTNVCAGATTTLSDGGTGTWSSDNTSVATISSSGLVTGASPGTATISYTVAGGCTATDVVTVNVQPPTITGSSSICIGASTTLSDTPSGGAWSSSDNTIATVGSASGSVTGVAAGTVIISYTMPGGCMATATVLVYGPEIPQICVVSLDTVSGKNVVVWEKTGILRAAQYNIYRLSPISTYVQIGSQASNVFSTFTDTGSYPLIQSYSYKLTLTDSCGNESDTSACTTHTTVHLNSGAGLSGSVNLVWNLYEGKTITTQNVMRSVGGGAFVNIAALANTVTSYTDAAPPSGSLVYRIDLTASGCTPTARTTAYETFSSNPVYVAPEGVTNVSAQQSIYIAPNPTHGNVDIYGIDKADISIYNILGQQIKESKQTNQISVADLPNGIYLIKLYTDNGALIYQNKIIKN